MEVELQPRPTLAAHNSPKAAMMSNRRFALSVHLNLNCTLCSLYRWIGRMCPAHATREPPGQSDRNFEPARQPIPCRPPSYDAISVRLPKKVCGIAAPAHDMSLTSESQFSSRPRSRHRHRSGPRSRRRCVERRVVRRLRRRLGDRIAGAGSTNLVMNRLFILRQHPSKFSVVSRAESRHDGAQPV